VQASAQLPAVVRQPVEFTHDGTQHSFAAPAAQVIPSIGVQVQAAHAPAPSQVFTQLSGLCQ
jgi:hypothetical protein